MATASGAGVSSGVPTQSLSTQFLNLIKSAIGTPYLWGGTNPFAGGADCSGLVYWAAGKLGLKVPRTSQEQWASLPHVPANQVQPGDLVFFAGSDGTMSAPGHVGIVTGPGTMIDDPHTTADVRYDSFTQNGVVGYARIPGISGSGPVVSVPNSGSSTGGGSGSGGGGSTSLWGTIWDGILGGLNLSASGPEGQVAQSLEQAGSATDATEQGLFAVAAPLIKIATALDWLFHPNHWVRIIAGVGGGVLVIGGTFQMFHTGGEIPVSAYGVSTSVGIPRAASLPLGILMTGFGGLLLFVAFHNLPASVTNISTLTGYLSDEITQGSIAAGAQPSGQ